MAQKNLVFDPEGDVTIVVEGEAMDLDTIEAATAKNWYQKASDATTCGGRVNDYECGGMKKAHLESAVTKTSSKHIRLASTVFSELLSSESIERTMLRRHGSVILRLHKHDATALSIIMTILHHKSREIPPKLSFVMLVNIALLINKYCLHDAFAAFTQLWIDRIMRRVWLEDLDTIYQWLGITWTLSHPEGFRRATEYAIKYGLDIHLDKLKHKKMFKIPDQVIVKISYARTRGIEAMLQIIDATIAKYTNPKSLCSCEQPGCSAMILGSLIQGLCENNLWPLPTYSTRSHTPAEINTAIEELTLSSRCNNGGSDIQYTLEMEVDDMCDKVEGLELSECAEAKTAVVVLEA